MPPKKITFDDKDLEIEDTPLDLTEGLIEDASEASEEEEDEGESDDSDDAPEEESLTSGKKAALEQTRAEDEIKAQVKQARRQAALQRQKAAVPKPTSSYVGPSTSAKEASEEQAEEPIAGPSYLPESIFADAAKEKALREEKEREIAARVEEEEEREEGQAGKKRRRRTDGEGRGRIRKRIGETSVRLLNESNSTQTSNLTPSATPRRIRRFKKETHQHGEARSDPLRSKMAVSGSSNAGEGSGQRQRGGKDELKRGWVRKEAHLALKQPRAGPSVGFFTGRLSQTQ